MLGLSTHPVTHHPAVALLLWVILVVMHYWYVTASPLLVVCLMHCTVLLLWYSMLCYWATGVSMLSNCLARSAGLPVVLDLLPIC